MSTEIILEKALNAVVPNVRFNKNDVVTAIQKAGNKKCVGIIYSEKGDRFLAIGSRSSSLRSSQVQFKVEEIVGAAGTVQEINGVDVLSVKSGFYGVKLTTEYGQVSNKLYNSPTLFANETVLNYTLQLALGDQ